MGLKKLGWKLGLTKETRKKESDLIYEDATVISKKHTEGFLLPGKPMNSPWGLRLASEEYEIKFWNIKSGTFTINRKEVFESFEGGEKVTVAYVKVFKEIYDYVPPNFDEKVLIETVPVGNRFVYAKK